VRRDTALLMMFSLLLCGCATAMSTPDTEATVQAAVMRTVVAAATQTAVPTQTPTFEDNLETLEEKLLSLCWVAYSPTHFDPDAEVYPSEDDIRVDLQTLHGAGFRGLVTYGSESTLRHIPRIAGETGFEGVIMGVWSPTGAEELANAVGAADYVDGYCVGNEGLFFGRYDLDTLKIAMDNLRATTGKPVATTEVLNSYYSDAQIRELGDWAFPNVHPYWNGMKSPQQAVTWTQQQFTDLNALYEERSKMVVLKEVGLPTAGDPELSEEGQAEYYKLLRSTDVRFFYFEAFDQPWKTSQPVEPHWGLFRSDRSPKPVINHVCGKTTVYLSLVLGQSTTGGGLFLTANRCANHAQGGAK
jgi:exo-beta-1,3-glucanase (GH17 family)